MVAPVRLETRAFGTIEQNAELPLSDDGIDWAPHLAFPGLEPDERLERRTRAPQRAAILAVDRTPLAKGPAAARTLAGSTLAVVGEVGTPTPEQAKELDGGRLSRGHADRYLGPRARLQRPPRRSSRRSADRPG